MITAAVYGAGMIMLLVTMTSGVAGSSPQAVPEIDGATVTTGLGLLTAGILLVRARMGR